MRSSKGNPAARAAGRAPNSFCLAADRAENSLPRSGAQDRRDFNAEARNQAAIVEWVRVVAPGVLIFAVPNGGYRTPAEAARLKWTGTVAGVPDLVVVAPGGRVFFLEVKTPTGRLSEAQRAIHESLVALGAAPAIVRSIEDARLAFAAWGIETREAGQCAAQ